MAGEDPIYLNWLRSQPCAAPEPCNRRCFDPHHSTNGSTVSPDELPRGKQLGGRRGKGQRAHDHFAFSLCKKHHDDFHDEAGVFAGWTKAQRRAWQDEQVRLHRARYAGHVENNPRAVAVEQAVVRGRRKQATSRNDAGLEKALEMLETYMADRRHSADAVEALDGFRVLLEGSLGGGVF